MSYNLIYNLIHYTCICILLYFHGHEFCCYYVLYYHLSSYLPSIMYMYIHIYTYSFMSCYYMFIWLLLLWSRNTVSDKTWQCGRSLVACNRSQNRPTWRRNMIWPRHEIWLIKQLQKLMMCSLVISCPIVDVFILCAVVCRAMLARCIWWMRTQPTILDAPSQILGIKKNWVCQRPWLFPLSVKSAFLAVREVRYSTCADSIDWSHAHQIW